MSFTRKQITNAANNMFSEYGENIRKHDIWLFVLLNKATRKLSPDEQDKLISSIWRKVKLIKQGILTNSERLK